MTDSRRPPLAERRKARAVASAERKQEFWKVRFDAAQTPAELVQANWDLLRTRLKQIERRALARVERAKSDEEKAAATMKLAEARQEIQRICDDASAELARLADQIDIGRR